MVVTPPWLKCFTSVFLELRCNPICTASSFTDANISWAWCISSVVLVSSAKSVSVMTTGWWWWLLLRSSQKLNIPLFRTASGQRTFYYRTVKLWHNLESFLKLSPSPFWQIWLLAVRWNCHFVTNSQISNRKLTLDGRETFEILLQPLRLLESKSSQPLRRFPKMTQKNGWYAKPFGKFIFLCKNTFLAPNSMCPRQTQFTRQTFFSFQTTLWGVARAGKHTNTLWPSSMWPAISNKLNPRPKKTAEVGGTVQKIFKRGQMKRPQRL